MKARETQCMVYLRNALEELERNDCELKYVKGRIRRTIDILIKMYKQKQKNN